MDIPGRTESETKQSKTPKSHESGKGIDRDERRWWGKDNWKTSYGLWNYQRTLSSKKVEIKANKPGLLKGGAIVPNNSEENLSFEDKSWALNLKLAPVTRFDGQEVPGYHSPPPSSGHRHRGTKVVQLCMWVLENPGPLAFTNTLSPPEPSFSPILSLWIYYWPL